MRFADRTCRSCPNPQDGGGLVAQGRKQGWRGDRGVQVLGTLVAGLALVACGASNGDRASDNTDGRTVPTSANVESSSTTTAIATTPVAPPTTTHAAASNTTATSPSTSAMGTATEPAVRNVTLLEGASLSGVKDHDEVHVTVPAPLGDWVLQCLNDDPGTCWAGETDS